MYGCCLPHGCVACDPTKRQSPFHRTPTLSLLIFLSLSPLLDPGLGPPHTTHWCVSPLDHVPSHDRRTLQRILRANFLRCLHF